ncbi:hypothetical protein MNBD_GAMMA22-289 [hydrothermal vent metagenome]|uniref:Cyclic nucleotide-binding domain-containing protein n=1 Tax=hydrothermal vent metagenome TaxID=652676 RepID=A0A3B0ZY08_9ZZZZ
MNKSNNPLFLDFLKQYVNINSKELNRLLNLFELQKYQNKTHIVKPSEANNTLFFIISGLVRYYYLTDDGKEWNRAFLAEGMMSTSLAGGLKSIDHYGIQVIEDSEILLADFSEFQLLFNDNPMIERLQRKLIENILITKMNRERSFLQSSAKQRYIDFVEQYPEIFQRVTQYHLASYLGITEASLSRIIS